MLYVLPVIDVSDVILLACAEEEIESLKSLQFSFGMIKQATEDFKEDNRLGQGGFGTVYKVTDFTRNLLNVTNGSFAILH